MIDIENKNCETWVPFNKPVGGKMAPKLVYIVLEKELLNFSVTAPSPVKSDSGMPDEMQWCFRP